LSRAHVSFLLFLFYFFFFFFLPGSAMSSAKPLLVRLCELATGQAGDFFALLSERTKSTTRDGKPYYLCKFRDARRTASVMVWVDSGRFEECEQAWREGEFYKIRGIFRESQRFGPQLEIQQIRNVQQSDRADGFDPTDLVERSRFDSSAMLNELRTLTQKHIADEPLRRLVLTILDRHAEALKRLPATRDKFYTFAGGLLEHTLAVTSICINLAEIYAARYAELSPPLNRDLVVAGAIVHDIGRVLEFGDEPMSPQPTVPGRLLGHLLLGRDLVRDTAKELADINPELIQLLEHMILTHLALPEWGSPRLPLVPEVLLIHHADDLDAKLEMYVRCLARDKESGPFTARDPALGKQLLKGRKV
jgi:3'-5' exoribonuclease